MIKSREIRLKCDVRDKCTMWNKKKACKECEKDNTSKIVRNSINVQQEENEVGGIKRNEKINKKEKGMRSIGLKSKV